MNKDDVEEGIRNEGQHPEPLLQDETDPEQIHEVDPDFEETKLSGDEGAYRSQDDEEYKEKVETVGSNMIQSVDYTERSMEKGSPTNLWFKQCIFAPDLVDPPSPEQRDELNREYSPSREISVFVEDPIVIRQDLADGKSMDQKPAASHHCRYESAAEKVPQGVVKAPVNTNDNIPDVNITQVSIATFTGGEKSERRSIDKETIRSSKVDSPTRPRIKSHFRKSNVKGTHKQMPRENSDSQDVF